MAGELRGAHISGPGGELLELPVPSAEGREKARPGKNVVEM